MLFIQAHHFLGQIKQKYLDTCVISVYNQCSV